MDQSDALETVGRRPASQQMSRGEGPRLDLLAVAAAHRRGDATARSSRRFEGLTWRLTSFLVVVVLGVLVTSYVAFRDTHRVLRNAQHVDELVDIAERIGAFVHETQRERGVSVLYLSVSADDYLAELIDRWTQTDRQLNRLEQFLLSTRRGAELHSRLMRMSDESDDLAEDGADGNAAGSGQVLFRLHSVASQLEELDELRRNIRSRSVSLDATLDWFKQLNEKCLAVVEEVSNVSENAAQVRRLNAYLSLLSVKEYSGRERAVLSNVFAADRFGKQLYQTFDNLNDFQQLHLQRFLATSSDGDREFYHDAMSDPRVAHVKRMRAVARQNADTGNFDIDPAEWFDTSTARIDILRKVENYLAAKLHDQAENIKAAATLRLGVVNGLSCLVLGIVASGGWWCLSSFQRMELHQREHRAALEASEDMHRTVTDTAVDGIITINSQRQVVFFNRAAEKLFGYSEQEIQGQNINILVPEPWHSQHDSYVQNYLSGKTAGVIGKGRHVKGLRKDGSTFPLFLSLGVFSMDGETYFTGIVRDTTEETRIKNDLENTVAEMEQQTWSKVHSGQILNDLQGVTSVADCAQQVISSLAPLMGAGYGAHFSSATGETTVGPTNVEV